MWSRRATGLTLVAFFVYLGANNSSVGWLYVIAALILGTMGACFLYPRLTLRGLAAARAVGGHAGPQSPARWDPWVRASGAIFEGDTVEVAVSLANPGARERYLVEVLDRVATPSGGAEVRALLVGAVAPQGRARVGYELPARRGRYRLGPARLLAWDPLGLFHSERMVGLRTTTVALPRYWRLEARPRAAVGDAGLRPSARRGTGPDFYGLRHYRPGDSLRDVHWRTTARLGTPVVKERERESQEPVTLVVDLQDVAGLDGRVRAAASLARLALGGEREVTLRAGATAHCVGDWRAALAWLAALEVAAGPTLADIVGGLEGLSGLLVVLCASDAPDLHAALGRVRGPALRTYALAQRPQAGALALREGPELAAELPL